jgi:hypothetical protein
MPTLKKSDLTKLADQAGISIGGSDASPYPTLEQLKAFAEGVRKLEAARAERVCRDIGTKHQQEDGTYAAGKKAGAFECADALLD